MTDINLKRQLTPFEWLQMPVEVRSLFIKWFKIPRTGGAIVQGDKVLSDGHTIEDLSVVSLASLQAFLHTDETHWDNLLQLTINKMGKKMDNTGADEAFKYNMRIEKENMIVFKLALYLSLGNEI